MALKVQMTSQMAVQLASPWATSSASSCRSTMMPLEGLRKPLRCTRYRAGVVMASGMAEPESTGTGGSGMVDSNMMVLRKRIQSIRLQETCYDSPADWAEWERNAYSSYRADLCLLLSTMQGQLLTMRPSTVLFIISVLMAVLPVMSILFISVVGTQLWGCVPEYRAWREAREVAAGMSHAAADHETVNDTTPK